MPEDVKEQQLTQERLNAFNNKEITFGDFNKTEREQIDELLKTGKVESRDVVEEKETPIPDNTALPEDLELKSVKTKLFEKGVEANRNKQLLEKATSNEEFLQGQLDKLKNTQITKATDDPFDDASQQNLREELSLVKQQLEGMITFQKDNNSAILQQTQTHHQELEVERGNLAIDKLQRNFPNLKTTVPMESLNNELAEFSKQVGGFENVNKYLEDEAFRKQKQEEGVKPLSDSFMNNLPAFNEIVELNNGFAVEKDDSGKSYKNRNPDIGIDTFYMSKLQTSGKYNEMLSNAKLAGANSVVDKVASQRSTATLMKPATGMNVPETGMTEALAYDIMKRIKPKMRDGEKLSPEEQQQWMEFQEYTKSKYGG